MRKRVFLGVAIVIFLAGFIFSASRTEAEINVYDKDGQYLGIMMSAEVDDEEGSELITFLPSEGIFFSFESSVVAPNHYDLVKIRSYYESTDCTGNSYFFSSTYLPYSITLQRYLFLCDKVSSRFRLCER